VYGRQSSSPLIFLQNTRCSTHMRTTLTLAVAGPRVWNSLPATIRQITSYGQFRQHLENTFTTHTRLTALCPGLPRRAGTRKVKPIWILLKQETVSGSGISWAICKSAHRSRQITTPAPHHSVFLQAGCPSCLPTNSVKALKEPKTHLLRT